MLGQLANEEARLAEVERAQEATRTRIAALRAELAALSPLAPSSPELPLAAGGLVPQTPAEKVKLFRSLFRGRHDVFPTRFESKKTGRPGYAPACSNKWEPGVCALKTGGRCSECAHQAFIPVGDQVITEDLKGRHVMGVYPLLVDETCWFLAADFDKSTWQDDVAAFSETCRGANVPVAIERSRSGNGAHVWFFFSAPVPADVARRMGCYLVTETMNRRHELSMDSYDRLFPNQDTLPRGGFGNLIALPLQQGPGRRGTASSWTSASHLTPTNGPSSPPFHGWRRARLRRSHEKPLGPVRLSASGSPSPSTTRRRPLPGRGSPPAERPRDAWRARSPRR